MRRVCVFCGSNVGARPEYLAAAQAMGRTLARRGLALVYGGGAIGLMGAVADATLAGGGQVHGVSPHALSGREIAHPGLTSLDVVPTMHERKARMSELSDAYVAMPGGLGTWDELFEVATWSYLGIHEKPIGLYDVAGYFGPFLRLHEHGVAEGFIRPELRGLFAVATEPDALLDAMIALRPPRIRKWAGPDEI